MMNNQSNTPVSTAFEHPVLDTIRIRRSIRAFADRPVEQDKIDSLFEAARWAPSSVNEQPWRYVYAGKETAPALWQDLFDALNEKNQEWVKNAPLLIASFVRRHFSRTQAVNHYAKYDLGAANAFLSLQAADVGLQIHQLGGYSEQRLRETLKVSDEFDMGAMMAVGYPGDPDQLPENLRNRELSPRTRNTQAFFVLNHQGLG